MQMAQLDELAAKFLVDDAMAPERLASVVEKLLQYCVVQKNGTVEIIGDQLSGKELVKLVLAARFVASRLSKGAVSEEVSAEDISQYTGLPKNQATARAKECVDEKCAERSARGTFRARGHKVDGFVAGLTIKKATQGGR
jgi:hypothetical protein